MQTAQDAPPADDIPTAPLPDYATRPDAAPETLVVGQLMGTFEAVYSAEDNANYLRDVRESLDLFTNEGIVHPGLILRMANRALSMNVRLGPWIHVSSEIRITAPPGSRRSGSRGRLLVVFDRLAAGIVPGEASGSMEDGQATVRVFVHPRLDVEMAVTVGGYLRDAVAHRVVVANDAYLLDAQTVF